MKIHHAKQGTGEWLALRQHHLTASEAPAMLGLSAYMTRSELLRQKATGITPDHDQSTLARFDRGHEAEAQFRPIAEEIIDSELYPVVGSITYEGLNLLASLDGITLIEDAIFEHKLWNDKLAEALRNNDDLPDTHWPQVEHQLLVSGATSCLFVTSNGTKDQWESISYKSHPERRQRVIDGWKQFAIDLENYQPETIIEKPKGMVVIDLPAVSVNVSGQIAVVDNLAKFTTALQAFIDRDLITTPETDQDFADLESQIKMLKKAEAALDSAEANMLAQIGDVETAKRMIDYARDIARDNRLWAEKLVKSKKELIKNELVMSARQKFISHLDALNAEIAPAKIEGITPDFNGAVKNKRTVSSLKDAVNTELAQVKIEADAQARGIRINLSHLSQNEAYRYLFSDLAAIAKKEPDDFAALVSARIAAEIARRDAEQRRIEAEAKARAELAAAEQLAASEEKIRADERAKAKAEAKARAEQQAASQTPELESIPEPSASEIGLIRAGNETETLLIIRHGFTDGFMRKAVADALEKYGIAVYSVDLKDI